jgi:hypothetical protein
LLNEPGDVLNTFLPSLAHCFDSPKALNPAFDLL